MESRFYIAEMIKERPEMESQRLVKPGKVPLFSNHPSSSYCHIPSDARLR